MHYSSSDFDKTTQTIKCRVPKNIHHKKVLQSGAREGFSQQRKHKVAVADLPSHTISMTVGELEPLQKTNLHRHNYETILYILSGTGYTVVENQMIHWQPGDAVYVPVWAWHRHGNSSAEVKASYLACENAPLLQNIGGVALREERGEI
jgi:gentisate 1,2-dioxygenase